MTAAVWDKITGHQNLRTSAEIGWAKEPKFFSWGPEQLSERMSTSKVR